MLRNYIIDLEELQWLDMKNNSDLLSNLIFNIPLIKETNWKTLALYLDDVKDILFLIVYRPNTKDIAWGSYYDINYKSWGHGHYNYNNIYEAFEDIQVLYGSNLKLLYSIEI